VPLDDPFFDCHAGPQYSSRAGTIGVRTAVSRPRPTQPGSFLGSEGLPGAVDDLAVGAVPRTPAWAGIRFWDWPLSLDGYCPKGAV
jgi:hypothetical protein